MCIFNQILPSLHSELCEQQGEHHTAAGGRLAKGKQPSEQNTSRRWEELGAAGGGAEPGVPGSLGSGH